MHPSGENAANNDLNVLLPIHFKPEKSACLRNELGKPLKNESAFHLYILSPCFLFKSCHGICSFSFHGSQKTNPIDFSDSHDISSGVTM